MIDIKIKRKEFIHVLFFCIYVVLYLTLLIGYGMGSEYSRWRYGALLLSIIVGAVGILRKYGINFLKKTKYNELLLFVVLGLIFLVQSFVICATNGYPVMSRTYVQIFLMVSPALYAFCILNLLSSKTIVKCFKFFFILSIILYFTENGHTLADFLDFSKYSTLFTKYSFVESAIFSEIFLQLFLLFNYFRNIKKDSDIRISKSYVIISLIFVILCGKRLAILMVILTPFINMFVRKIQKNEGKKKAGNKKIFVFLTIVTVAGTIFYTLVLQRKILQDFDVYWFTTGRDYILSLWENRGYVSYGYGSSTVIIGRYLELDLVQVYLEMGIVSLTIFCATYLNSARKNLYGLGVMFYSILNMLTASSIPYSLGWIFVFLVIKVIEDSDTKRITAWRK